MRRSQLIRDPMAIWLYLYIRPMVSTTLCIDQQIRVGDRKTLQCGFQ